MLTVKMFRFLTAAGRMVYMSSIFAFFNCLNMGAYSVSKRGLEAFADCLRVEMASFGVKVQWRSKTTHNSCDTSLCEAWGVPLWEVCGR